MQSSSKEPLFHFKLLHVFSEPRVDRYWNLSVHRLKAGNEFLIATCSNKPRVSVFHVKLDCYNDSLNAPSAFNSPTISLLHTYHLDGVLSKTVRMVSFNDQGSLLSAASFDGSIGIWSVTVEPSNQACSISFKIVACLEGHENEVKGLSWRKDGDYLATCGRDRSVWIWSVAERPFVELGPLPTLQWDFECDGVIHEHSQDVKCIAWHQEEKLLVSAGYDEIINLIKGRQSAEGASDDLDWGVEKTTTKLGGTVWNCQWINKESVIISTENGQLIIWTPFHENYQDSPVVSKAADLDLLNDDLQKFDFVHEGPIYALDCNLESGLMLTGGEDRTIKVHRITIDDNDNNSGDNHVPYYRMTLIAEHQFAHDSDINCLRWLMVAKQDHENSKLCVFASASDDGKIKIWQVNLGNAE